MVSPETPRLPDGMACALGSPGLFWGTSDVLGACGARSVRMGDLSLTAQQPLSFRFDLATGEAGVHVAAGCKTRLNPGNVSLASPHDVFQLPEAVCRGQTCSIPRISCISFFRSDGRWVSEETSPETFRWRSGFFFPSRDGRGVRCIHRGVCRAFEETSFRPNPRIAFRPTRSLLPRLLGSSRPSSFREHPVSARGSLPTFFSPSRSFPSSPREVPEDVLPSLSPIKKEFPNP